MRLGWRLAAIISSVVVNWYSLSTNPAAIQLLEEDLDYISWHSLSSNPAAIHLLEKNLDKIEWDSLSLNPAIFVKSKKREELLRVLLDL